jgi:hypothetical protein
VLEDEVFDDGDAEAGAGDFLGAAFVDGVEAAEDSARSSAGMPSPWSVMRTMPRSKVLETSMSMEACSPPYFDCVVEEVDEGLLEAHGVAVNVGTFAGDHEAEFVRRGDVAETSQRSSRKRRRSISVRSRLRSPAPM